jgi:hypothetical protein
MSNNREVLDNNSICLTERHPSTIFGASLNLSSLCSRLKTGVLFLYSVVMHRLSYWKEDA